MKKLIVGFLLVVFMSFSFQDIVAQEVVSDEVSVVVSGDEAVLTSGSIEESLKICKDESGEFKVCDNKDLVSHLMVSIGGFKGMSALAIAFFISKFLLLLILSPFFKDVFPKLDQGRYKLFIAVSMNLVVGVLALMVPPVSLSFSAAITHSSVLALLSVFANQAYKQFFTEKGKA